MNYNGVATPVNYTVNDNLGLVSNSATISITVDAVNDAPVAGNNSETTNEDTPVTIAVTGNDTDVDGTINVATVDLDPATTGIQTTFTVVDEGTYTVDALGIVTFTPVLNYNGVATPVNYTVNDNLGLVSNSATISITVTAVNDTPIVDNDTNVMLEDGTPATGDLTDAGDSDPDGTVLLVNTTPVSGPANGTIVIRTDGTYTYTPNANFNGTDVITIQVCDQGIPLAAICVNQTLTITVTPVNDAPVANNDNAITNEDTPVTICSNIKRYRC